MASVHAATAEFAGLDDKAMAARLVDLARRLVDSGRFNPDPRYSYDEWALNRVIPELARRLDPEMTLLPREIPQPEEAADPVTWLGGMSDSRFASCIRSVMEQASFRRDAPRGFSLDQELITHQKGPVHSAAARVFPQIFEAPDHDDDSRPGLEGFQVIAAHEHRDVVVCHLEDEDSAGRLLDHVVKVRLSADAEAARVAHQEMVRDFPFTVFRGDPERVRNTNILSFSVQRAGDGEILKLYEIERVVPEPEAEADLPFAEP